MLDLFRTLPRILKDAEGAEELRKALVFAAWKGTAGDGLADHVVPVEFENGRLTVAVSSLTWQRHLKDLCGQMIFKLNATLGEPVVNFIELQIDELAVNEHKARTRTTAELDLRGAEDEITPELAMAADGIQDDELRRQFLLAAGNCLVRRRTKLASRQ